MIVGRFFGWVFLVCGVLVLVRDFWASAKLGTWSSIALGQLWYDLSRTSLIMTQAGIQRYVSARAWDVIDQMLAIWAFVAFILIGIGLLVAFHRRRDIVE